MSVASWAKDHGVVTERLPRQKSLVPTAAMSQQEAKLLRYCDEKWLNADPFGRSATEAPQGDGVDGKGKSKGRTELSSMSQYDEGYRQPSKNMAAASDTHSNEYTGATLSKGGLRG